MNQLVTFQNNRLKVALSSRTHRILDEPGIPRGLLRNDFRTVPAEVRLGVIAPVVNHLIAFPGQKLEITMFARASGNLALHEGGYSSCHRLNPFYKRVCARESIPALLLSCSLYEQKDTHLS